MVTRRKYQKDRKGQDISTEKWHKAPETQEVLPMAQSVRHFYLYINFTNLNPKIWATLIKLSSYVL